MPRDIPVGNGALLVTFDQHYFIRDLYWPHVGEENQTLGHRGRFGVWADGHFAWLDDKRWQSAGGSGLRLDYAGETLVTAVRCHHDRLQLELDCRDTVDFHRPIYLKQLTLRNWERRDREVRLFFNQDFLIFGNAIGDTAYYDPRSRAIIHYKNCRYFLANCAVPGRGDGDNPALTTGVDQWACGTKKVNGAEGTWRDAEDGVLGGNAIAQGSVDSTIGVRVALPAHGERTLYYWIACGRNYDEVAAHNAFLESRGPREVLHRTASYWHLWVNKEAMNFADLPPAVVRLFKRSLLIIRTQIDNKGAVLAANDGDVVGFNQDTYSYVWPRDGALTAYALDLAGYSEATRRFFNFCADLITLEGYLHHKYTPTGGMASSWHPWIHNGKPELPIQEDETALVVWSLRQHFLKYHDIEFLSPLYRRLIVRAGEFMVAYRDPVTKLPLPSYDLWEERHGIHTFTVAAVIGGLEAAAGFARDFGEEALAQRYADAAREVRDAAVAHLFDAKLGCFARMAVPVDGHLKLDMTIDASLYGLFAFGAFDPDDPRVVSTMDHVRNRLTVRTHVGGVARYENDSYHQVSKDVGHVPGNPWFICTLWLAQYDIARARTVAEARRAIPVLEWVVSRALPSGVLAEQVHPHTGAPMSVSPLTWSHATFVAVVVEYLRKLQEFEDRDHPNHFLVNGHQLAGSQPGRAREGLVPAIAWDRVL
jgi:GH15 family glucan-1,4-alpha-glucosidase